MDNEFTQAELDEIFRRLRELKAKFGPKPNLEDRAQALIGACILEGFDTRRRIVGALRQIELDYRYVNIVLNGRTGTTPGVSLAMRRRRTVSPPRRHLTAQHDPVALLPVRPGLRRLSPSCGRDLAKRRVYK